MICADLLICQTMVDRGWWCIHQGVSLTSVPGSLTLVPGSLTLVLGSLTSVPESLTLVPGSLTLVHGSMTLVHGSLTLVHGSLALVPRSLILLITFSNKANSLRITMLKWFPFQSFNTASGIPCAVFQLGPYSLSWFQSPNISSCFSSGNSWCVWYGSLL